MITKSGQKYIGKITAPSPVGDADQWHYEFRPGEKYPDLGIYTILAPNPDAGKEGVVYSGAEIAMADTDDKEVAAQIVKEHNSHRKLVEALILARKMFMYITEATRLASAHEQAQQGTNAIDDVLAREVNSHE